MRLKTRRARRNKTVRAQRGGNAGKTLVFYHIYCNKSTHDVVKNQIVNIVFSGLYDRVDGIHCFLVGEPHYIDKLEELIQASGKKFHVTARGPHDKTYERFTLLRIRNHVGPADKFLYMHSKGVSKDKNDNIFWWKTYMEYFLMVKAEECLRLLDTYDTVGVKWDSGSTYEDYVVPNHYSGNFWWTKGSYFLTLPLEIGNRYTDPESYISQKNPKHYVLDSHVNKPGPNFYNVAVTPQYYVDT